jgi:hypothetical protein
MKHSPHGDDTGLTTGQLVCVLVSRIDASDSLFSLLALLAESSEELSVDRQRRLAASLHDLGNLIEQRPPVRGWVDFLKAMTAPTTDETRPTP